MSRIHASIALLPDGWARDVVVELTEDGRIASVATGVTAAANPPATSVGLLLPAMPNLHSHAFQRAMAGLTEGRGAGQTDSFWTWRKLMYSFLDHLTPDDIESIAAFAQMQMLEHGYASVGEFHYLHHQSGGVPYDNLAELSTRVCAAAEQSGIGLTLLPVLYQRGGCDDRPLADGQLRFGNSLDQYNRLTDGCRSSLAALANDAVLGIAVHSLRAVSADSLTHAAQMIGDSPVHLHIAEQQAEVTEVEDAYGARPLQWLLNNMAVDSRWCLIHCTQSQPEETLALARSGAIAGLCPVTESSLGDGIFDGHRFVDAAGRFGIGTDSNIAISVADELRTLEYSQRLRDKNRAVFASDEKSSGRNLYEMCSVAGAIALGRNGGIIESGRVADLTAIDLNSVDFAARTKDQLLDSYIFVTGDSVVSNVWSAGRHVVQDKKHIRRDAIVQRYANTQKALLGKL